MIDASVIVTALRKQLNSSATIVSEGITVEQGEYVNFDPDRCPWVGCYKSKISYAPLSLGRHSTSWDATVELKIVIQASHGNSGQECDARLSSYETLVLDAVWSNPTIGGNVDVIEGMVVEYSYNETESESLFFQQAIITLTTEVQTG